MSRPADIRGALYLVPTPVGNLEDITHRALRVLAEVDLIACEDTRTSGVLLQRYGIETARTSFHAHNEHAKAPALVNRMLGGESVALISDAGTPAISDPGFLLVREAVAAGVPVVALPGPTAFVPALIASGLPADRFVFEGFLPQKKGRASRLAALAGESKTVVLYESPHRLGRLLRELVEYCGEGRQAAVARELTKVHEEVRRGTLADLLAEFASRDRVRGEVVVVLAGAGAEKGEKGEREESGESGERGTRGQTAQRSSPPRP